MKVTDDTMDHRSRVIVELLRNLTLASESAGPSGVRSSTGERVPLLPHEASCRIHRDTEIGKLRCDCWLASVRELQRCLRVMYRDHRKLFRAVYERYVNCDCRPRTVTFKTVTVARREEQRLTIGGYDGPFEVLTLLPRGNGSVRARVETWRTDIQATDIDSGLAWLSEAFDGHPRLPREWRIEEAA